MINLNNCKHGDILPCTNLNTMLMYISKFKGDIPNNAPQHLILYIIDNCVDISINNNFGIRYDNGKVFKSDNHDFDVSHILTNSDGVKYIMDNFDVDFSGGINHELTELMKSNIDLI